MENTMGLDAIVFRRTPQVRPDHLGLELVRDEATGEWDTVVGIPGLSQDERIAASERIGNIALLVYLRGVFSAPGTNVPVLLQVLYRDLVDEALPMDANPRILAEVESLYARFKDDAFACAFLDQMRRLAEVSVAEGNPIVLL